MKNLLSTDTTPCLRHGESEADYHANRDFIGSSSLRQILVSPKTFRYSWENPLEDNEDLIFGRVIHQVVLEGKHDYIVMPKFDGHANSNVHKAAKAEWLAANAHKNVIDEKNFAKIDGVVESVLGHEDAAKLLKDGLVECSGYYSDAGIACKIRPDFYNRRLNAVIDLKTCQSVKMHDFSRDIWARRYDFQLAMYGRGLELITGTRPDYYVFLAVQKTAPFESAVYVADAEMIARGLSDYETALARLKNCVELDEWPQAQQHLETISLTYFAKKDA